MKNHLLFLLFTISTLISHGQSKENYHQEWNQVYQYELKRLPKSALESVELIYRKAKEQDNSPQLIKALLYKSKFALILEEDAKFKVIDGLITEIEQASFPTKNFLESILADLYWQYFQQNRWKFYNRTETDEKVNASDFRTWDLNTLFKECQLHFQNSLENHEYLQRSDLKDFTIILDVHEDSKQHRPTVFDFLAHRALEFYKNQEQYITRPRYKFEITNIDLLKENDSFLAVDLKSKDSLSQHLSALKVFKDLTAFHRKSADKNALVAITLERLDFVKSNAVFEDVEKTYEETLKVFQEKFENTPHETEIAFNLAKFYNTLGDRYNSKTNLNYQYQKKEALLLCQNAIKKFPDSKGTEKCKLLKEQILQKELSLLAEGFQPINTPSRILVNYKNLHQLYFKAFKLTKKQKTEFGKIYNDSVKTAFISNLELAKNWEAPLKDVGDYQNHSMEVLLPPLAQGEYLLLASPEQNLDSVKLYGYTSIQVTNLVLVNESNTEKNGYQVLDRNDGHPVIGAKVNLKSNRRRDKFNKNFVTNKEGRFSFKSKDYHYGLMASVAFGDDNAAFNGVSINNTENQFDEETEKEIKVKTFVFTDRSIYRPGQTVYFKCIALKKQGEVTELLTDEYVEVLLEDPNGQELGELNLKLNEFGSVAGEFKLPSNGLTGEYAIYVDESYEYDSALYDENDNYWGFDYDKEHPFSVEEYKRPKFETLFEAISESYRVNDSIAVRGKANAFAGSPISNAKVSYRVIRTASLPRWYQWRYPQYLPDEIEILNGETTTDDSGNYEVIFKAIPEAALTQENLPIFNYRVTADVTDINGETRSAQTMVRIGYHTLEASLNIPEGINRTDGPQKINIDTKNLNGEFVGTTGELKIYKLRAPEQPLRERPWEVPDYSSFSREEFKKLFPHEAFSPAETEVKNWERGQIVFENSFNTNISQEIIIENFSQWKTGSYVAVLQSQDKFGQKVKDEAQFKIFDNNHTLISDNQLFTITTDKDFYNPGDVVSLKIGSASENVTIMLVVEKNHQIQASYVIPLFNETKTISIPVTKKDAGGFSIKYHFVCYNSFSSGSLPITVPYTEDLLEIETLTFRDKLQPGKTQTWAFKIKGDKGNKMTAELLASMYDASLDQFKDHNWSFDPVNRYAYYSRYGSSAHQSFEQNQFYIKNKPHSYIRYPEQFYDRLNWFGFSFNNQRLESRRYLQSLKRSVIEKQVVSTHDDTKKGGFIYGQVLDDNGIPLPGVSIVIKGTTIGTQSDFDGNFAIQAKKGQELVLSYIGQRDVTIDIGRSNTYAVTMTEDSQALEEVVVTGMGVRREKSALGYAVTSVQDETISGDVSSILSGKVAGVQVSNASGAPGETTNVVIRGLNSLSDEKNALYIIDGLPVNTFELSPDEIGSIEVLKENAATALYGSKGANGVVIITTKMAQAKLEAELAKVQARSNLQETAFFFPQLRTNKKGVVQFEFTIPEALTRWKLQLLAHSKELKTAVKTLSSVTQKKLMVLPNPPRFLREGDTLVFSSKITNLTQKILNGNVQLILSDAVTGTEIPQLIHNEPTIKPFSVDAKGNTSVDWTLQIPEGIQAVQYKVVAKAGDFSDGEQNVLPVLTNRMLVTESLPLFVKGSQTKTFTLDKLQSNNSPTLSHHKLTLEATSNPVWYAIQALPYLMEYPYECSEQTFSRFYANILASHIANKNPNIKEIFKRWKDSEAMLSNLEKNEDLKSLVIEETPWLRDAQSESEQKKRIALLFDLDRMNNELEKSLFKLQQMQMSSGGFPWFSGSRYENRYITQHIVSGYGHLKKLGVVSDSSNVIDTKALKKNNKMMERAIKFLDRAIAQDYQELLLEAMKIKKRAETEDEGKQAEKEFLARKQVSYFQLHYLYMRSFYDLPVEEEATQGAIDYFSKQTARFWSDFSLYGKGLIALVHYRKGNQEIANTILNSLTENSISSEELGMYWKENVSGYSWYQAQIETHALLIEAYSEVQSSEIEVIDNLKTWLLKNKQTNKWETTKATTEAIYALLLKGSDWLETDNPIEITLGNKKIVPEKIPELQAEAGIGYFKISFSKDEVKPEMASVTLKKEGSDIAWGALYWQYFENLDKITSAQTPLQLSKELFLKKNTDSGEKLERITNKTQLNLGDLIRVRIELKVDRDIEFVHMKDMRGSGLEPINVLSKYKWQDGLGYYESTRDASTNFFFEKLSKGVYVFEYDLRINNRGAFSNGITTIQSMYAPEFSSHSEGVRVSIK